MRNLSQSKRAILKSKQYKFINHNHCVISLCAKYCANSTCIDSTCADSAYFDSTYSDSTGGGGESQLYLCDLSNSHNYKNPHYFYKTIRRKCRAVARFYESFLPLLLARFHKSTCKNKRLVRFTHFIPHIPHKGIAMKT